MEEQWKTIIMNGITYDNYEVSNLGRVRSLSYDKTGKIKLLKPNVREDGYLQIRIYKDGKRYTFRLHRVVATMFVLNDNPTVKTEINHKDCNPQNNVYTNLEWCTREYNMKYSHTGKALTDEHKQKLSDAKKGSSNPNSKKIMCIETEQVFNTCIDACKWCGCSKQALCNCLKGTSETCKGYHWKYVE